MVDSGIQLYTARSFVTYYAQRISHAIVMRGVDGIHKGISRMQCARLRRAGVRRLWVPRPG